MTQDLFRRRPVREDLVERTLDAVCAFAGGRCAALFRVQRDRIHLAGSRGLDQLALEAAQGAWSRERRTLDSGEMVVEAAPGRSVAVVPLVEADRLSGLLYVQTEQSRFSTPRDREALRQFAHIAIGVLVHEGAPLDLIEVDPALERAVSEEAERQQLVALLEHHEWNVARVARAISRTRATVYNRMDRLGIERRRVPKGSPRRAPA